LGIRERHTIATKRERGGKNRLPEMLPSLHARIKPQCGYGPIAAYWFRHNRLQGFEWGRQWNRDCASLGQGGLHVTYGGLALLMRERLLLQKKKGQKFQRGVQWSAEVRGSVLVTIEGISKVSKEGSKKGKWSSIRWRIQVGLTRFLDRDVKK